MNLDPKQTEALRAVVETGSFEQAAQRLHLTASAVSQRVRALESKLGNPLVVRSRPARATPVGQRLLQYLRRVMQLEADLATDLAVENYSPLSLTIALNADTLGTWFFPALAQALVNEEVLIDLTVEDQDYTYALLESGMAIGCIGSEEKPMKGCFAEPLGVMRYRLIASKSFCARWFAQGLNRNDARRAPVVAYSHKDTLQASFLEAHFGLLADAYPCHYVPGTEPHLAAIRHGLGYGMVPELLLGNGLEDLVDLAPDFPCDVRLFWHSWKVQSPRMEALSQQIIGAARSVLVHGF
ncbi:HTH-type transcriptional regulator ArgP [Iodobacter sp.]|uniref:HTH-type transcriptional regulator ArgP n=1 Tax=Iodobacter sp. TaxID=1915058 RepID=UPI0025F58316|nr:HTH-type transcriptional regulator ArgP [Iodobacter sp.]